MESHVLRKLERQLAVFEHKGGGTQVLFQIVIDNAIPPYDENFWHSEETRMDWAKRCYEYQTRVSEVLDDDMIPALSVPTGTEIFAEAFGCGVFFPKNDNPCAVHFVSSPAEAARVKLPALEDTKLPRLFRMADEMRAFGGPDAILKLPDMQSPMDIAAQIWDKTDLLPAMLEEPAAVHGLSEKAYALLTAFLDEWFRRYGRPFGAHYPDYVMNSGVSMSVDEVGIISPALFEEFFAGELAALSERYGGIGIHCCADSEHQLENFARVPGLKLINLHRPRESRRRAYQIFRDICVQCHAGTGDEPFYIGEEPGIVIPEGSRVFLRDHAANLDEAHAKCDAYARKYRP